MGHDTAASRRADATTRDDSLAAGAWRRYQGREYDLVGAILVIALEGFLLLPLTNG